MKRLSKIQSTIKINYETWIKKKARLIAKVVPVSGFTWGLLSWVPRALTLLWWQMEGYLFKQSNKHYHCLNNNLSCTNYRYPKTVINFFLQFIIIILKNTYPLVCKEGIVILYINEGWRAEFVNILGGTKITFFPIYIVLFAPKTL